MSLKDWKQLVQQKVSLREEISDIRQTLEESRLKKAMQRAQVDEIFEPVTKAISRSREEQQRVIWEYLGDEVGRPLLKALPAPQPPAPLAIEEPPDEDEDETQELVKVKPMYTSGLDTIFLEKKGYYIDPNELALHYDEDEITEIRVLAHKDITEYGSEQRRTVNKNVLVMVDKLKEDRKKAAYISKLDKILGNKGNYQVDI